MNPFQQADNFDDIGSGSNSLLDVQDSCMNENEMENLINDNSQIALGTISSKVAL
jgi:hypothetical protein